MRVFAVSDVHVDYPENKDWLLNLSKTEFIDDVLILAGDLTDDLTLLDQCFQSLSKAFLHVAYVPGNHELWTTRNNEIELNSFEKFERVCKIAKDNGFAIQHLQLDSLSIVPLFSWYDFSFGSPNDQLKQSWVDFRACQWPDDFSQDDVTQYFLKKNQSQLLVKNQTVISFSHFLPRIDLMPFYIPPQFRYIYPVLGCEDLEKQLRILKPDIHVYGHSHVNRDVKLEGIQYINNAFGYPSEDRIASKELKCIFEH